MVFEIKFTGYGKLTQSPQIWTRDCRMGRQKGISCIVQFLKAAPRYGEAALVDPLRSSCS